MELLQAQEILRRCFVNNENIIRAGSAGSTQDYFNAVYDETKDALRINFADGSAGFIYWGAPVATPGLLPAEGLEGEVRFVFDDGTGNPALYYYEGGNWHKFSGSGGTLEIQDEGVTIESAATILNFIGADVVAMGGGGNKVNVYIPSVTFVSNFNTTNGSNNCLVGDVSTVNRHISAPISEGNPFGIGSWSSGTVHSTTRENILTYSTNNACSFIDNSTTTIEANIYGADGSTVLATHTTSAISGNIDITVDNIRIKISSFGTDLSKYRGIVDVEFNINAILGSGGRFSIEIIHHNGADGDFTKMQNDIFYDAETYQSILGSVNIAETASGKVIVQKSGVYEYGLGSQFSVTVSDIDYINSDSYPTNFVNVSGSEYGLSTLEIEGFELTDWTDIYNNQNASYSKDDWAITRNNYFVKTTTANVNARTIDWVNGSWIGSSNENIIVDTYIDDSNRIYEDFTGETNRLESDLSTRWDSTLSLLTANGGNGLQVSDGSFLFYPSIDYTVYNPMKSNQPSYSTATGDRFYYRRMWHNNISHSNGLFHILGVTENNINNDEIVLEISLDGVNWYNCNEDYAGGSLSDGDGCRINSGTKIMPNLEFTLGTGGFTDVSTGGGWGVYIKIKIPATSSVKMDLIEITNWV